MAICFVMIIALSERKIWWNSVQFSCSVVSDSLQPHRLQRTGLPCPPPTPGAYSNSYPLSQWRHPTVSSSVIPCSSCLQSLPASGSFLSQFFTSGGQGIGASASAVNLFEVLILSLSFGVVLRIICLPVIIFSPYPMYPVYYLNNFVEVQLLCII